jgi:hypothetical protein
MRIGPVDQMISDQVIGDQVIGDQTAGSDAAGLVCDGARIAIFPKPRNRLGG